MEWGVGRTMSGAGDVVGFWAADPKSNDGVGIPLNAEYAWEEFNRTGSTHDLAPFWRVVESNSPMAKKLNFDPAWIELQQELEKQGN